MNKYRTTPGGILDNVLKHVLLRQRIVLQNSNYLVQRFQCWDNGVYFSQGECKLGSAVSSIDENSNLKKRMKVSYCTNEKNCFFDIAEVVCC